MAETFKMQADGQDGDADAKVPDGVNSAGWQAGSGGAYPNPHTGKKPEGGGFFGHGGQTEIAYHGPKQLGDQKLAERDNENAATGTTHSEG